MSDTPGPLNATSLEQVYDFMRAHPVGVLATVDPNSNPHAVVVYYSVDEEGNLFFTTKRDTKKSDNIQHNNHVMLAVYEASTQTSLQISGTAEDISESPEANEVFQNTMHATLQTSESGVPPISKLYAGHYVAYKVRPAEIRMVSFAKPVNGNYEDLYQTIDFEPK